MRVFLWFAALTPWHSWLEVCHILNCLTSCQSRRCARVELFSRLLYAINRPCQFAVTLIGFGFFLSYQANAANSLSLISGNGLIGQQVVASINLSTDAPVAGINAHIVLPDGIANVAVSQGEMLGQVGGFNLDFNLSGNDLYLVAYSSSSTVLGSGEVVQLRLTLAASAPVGLRSLGFAGSNANPLINRKHALSNDSGSVSLPHSATGTSFLVYSATSDYDGDGLPDAYEMDNGLNPLLSNIGMDSDLDGFSDVAEFAAGTDPKDPNSFPPDSGEAQVYKSNMLQIILMKKALEK